MSNLAGQHRDLSSVVGVVSDQIADKSSDVGTKALIRPSVSRASADHVAESMAARLQWLSTLVFGVTVARSN